MKAESIEQIREHLARGGRVLDAWGDEIDGLGRVCVYLKNKSAIYRISDLTSEAIAKWELLPLEENLADQTFCDECKYKSASGDFCSKCRRLWAWLRGELKEEKHAGDCTVYASKSNGLPTDGICTCGVELRKSRDIPGVPASSLPLVTEDPTGESCDNCEHCHGKGGRWDDESIDQWYWCEHCDAAKEYYAPILEKKKRKEKRHHELRAKVLFGQPWSIEEQLEVWELLTGEKIEHGRRCDECGGDGKSREKRQHGIYYGYSDCSECAGRGYTVRPTWMGERV